MNQQNKEQYLAELNVLAPSEEAMARLRATENPPAQSRTQKRPRAFFDRPEILRRFGAGSLAAAALLLALTLSLFRPILPQTGTLPGTENHSGTITQSFSDYSEIYAEIFRGKDYTFYYGDSVVLEESAVDPSTNASVGTSGENKSNENVGFTGDNAEPSDTVRGDSPPAETSEHSDTNNQVEGVQEGDLVKTDGRYLYSLSRRLDQSGFARTVLCITSVDETGRITLHSQTDLGELFVPKQNRFVSNEFYLYENRLIVMQSDTSSGSVQTFAHIVDISDVCTPRAVSQFVQDGDYSSARMVGEHLYLVTEHTLSYSSIKEADPSTFVPTCGTAEEPCLVAPEDICLLPGEDNPYFACYTVVGGITVSGEPSYDSQKAVFGNTSALYATRENLYLAAYDLSDTQLLRFSLQNGAVALAAEGQVQGNVLNQFSMQEKDGAFFIVTTYTESGWQLNGLFSFDLNFNSLGSLTGLGKSERVYSVRFLNECVYFVTYRKTDPLYCVDLSDPKNPTLLSELKITGFSSYLHPWSEDTLLGLGRADENGDGQSEGVKFSVYEIADKTAILENQKLLFQNEDYTARRYESLYSPAEDNHKAILVAFEKNLVAFSLFAPGTGNDYLIFLRETDSVFSQTVIPVSAPEEEAYKLHGYRNFRFLYLGGTLCVFSDSEMLTFSLETLSQIDKVNF